MKQNSFEQTPHPSRLDFSKFDWQEQAPGLRTKEFLMENRRIRLLEFTEHFSESDWCVKGHIGYVVGGRITIDFAGKAVLFEQGDGIFIPVGESGKHKASVARGENAILFLCDAT